MIVKNYLDLEICHSDAAEWSATSVSYQCGLQVTTEFMFKEAPPTFMAAKTAHQKHHDNCEPVASWWMEDTVQTDEKAGSVTITAKCHHAK